jgi:hypothetical protein
MRRLVCALALLGSVSMVGCGGSSYEGPTRYPLTGKVTLDGEPVNGGSISFLPEMPDSAEQRVTGGPIENGAYSVPAEQGANSGKYRVEVRWPKPTGKKFKDSDTGEMLDTVKEAVPAKYNIQSELTADVSAEKTTFDFDLKSK